jgi:hypothetical protein
VRCFLTDSLSLKGGGIYPHIFIQTSLRRHKVPILNQALQQDDVWRHTETWSYGFRCCLWHWIRVASFMVQPLYPGQGAPIPIVLKDGWTPEPVWTLWRRIPIPPYSACSLVTTILKGTRTKIRSPHTALILMQFSSICLCTSTNMSCYIQTRARYLMK